jgi:hypothetical protein
MIDFNEVRGHMRLILMGYAGTCDEFGKGSLLICILCYVRSVVLCVTDGFVSFIFIFLILYLSLLRTYLLCLYYSRGGGDGDVVDMDMSYGRWVSKI